MAEGYFQTENVESNHCLENKNNLKYDLLALWQQSYSSVLQRQGDKHNRNEKQYHLTISRVHNF